MSETDTLGLDYCISTPEVQLIQSQFVHNEHMHNGNLPGNLPGAAAPDPR